jgi:SOS-response transcriptional repressor LexA
MTTMAERISEAIDASGKQSHEIAVACGVTPASVTHWKNGSTKSLKAVTAQKFSEVTGYREKWLTSGVGPKKEEVVDEPSNVKPLVSKAKVPVISWIQAGELSDVLDTIYPGEVERWVDAQTVTPTRNAFALVVSGDSMQNKQGLSKHNFPPGTVLIVDPERACGAGDFVIAKDVATQQASFKQLVMDGGRWYLKPINSQYPTIEIDDPDLRVIGRVVEATYPPIKLI